MRHRRINLFHSTGIFFLVMAVLSLYFTCSMAAEASKTTHEYSADKMTYDNKSGVTVLEGNAKFRRSDDDYLYADQITMYRDVDTDEIIKLESVGKVEMKEESMSATCEHSIFYEKENRIEFKGSIHKPAIVDSGDNRMEAPFIIYFREEERISASGLLFSVGVKFQGDLDNGTIPDGLRQEFSKNRVTLSDSFVVSTEEADDRWSITDGDKVYTVKKEKDRLDILALGSVRGHITVEVKEDESAEGNTEEK